MALVLKTSRGKTLASSNLALPAKNMGATGTAAPVRQSSRYGWVCTLAICESRRRCDGGSIPPASTKVIIGPVAQIGGASASDSGSEGSWFKFRMACQWGCRLVGGHLLCTQKTTVRLGSPPPSAGIAQLAERQPCKLRVGGSIPPAGSTILNGAVAKWQTRCA